MEVLYVRSKKFSAGFEFIFVVLNDVNFIIFFVKNESMPSGRIFYLLGLNLELKKKQNEYLDAFFQGSRYHTR